MDQHRSIQIPTRIAASLPQVLRRIRDDGTGVTADGPTSGGVRPESFDWVHNLGRHRGSMDLTREEEAILNGEEGEGKQ